MISGRSAGSEVLIRLRRAALALADLPDSSPCMPNVGGALEVLRSLREQKLTYLALARQVYGMSPSSSRKGAPAEVQDLEDDIAADLEDAITFLAPDVRDPFDALTEMR